MGPIFFAAQLLANLFVFWIVLGLEAFSKEMQVGTYVIVVAVVLLIINGPQGQDYGDTTFQELISEFYALIWAWILTISMVVTGFILLAVDLHERKVWFRFTVLLVARASAFSLNLTSGKAMVLPIDRFWLIVNICIKIISGIVYTRAIVVQSTAVEQKTFVPLNAATIVFINALTGIAIWEDYNVIQSWLGYVCVFLLLALGCSLLLGDLGLLQETSPETFRGARPSMFIKAERTKLLDNLKGIGAKIDQEELENCFSEEADGSPQAQFQGVSPFRTHSHLEENQNHRLSRFGRHRSRDSKMAWASVFEGAHATGQNPHRLSMIGCNRRTWQSIQRELEKDLVISADNSMVSETSGKHVRFADASRTKLVPPGRMSSLEEGEREESSSRLEVKETVMPNNGTAEQIDTVSETDNVDLEVDHDSDNNSDRSGTELSV